MSPAISIIVPVYNVEKYLDRCVCSLIRQTLSDTEIILVDDGSPDTCPKLCDVWAEKDSRIRVVHKPNGGLASARNAGLDVATGEYVAFVDSDDYVLDDTYSTLFAAAKQGDFDVVYNGYTYYLPEGTKEDKAVTDCECRDMEKYVTSMLGDDNYVISACMGIYRRSVIADNHLQFLSEREYLSEDVLFNLDFLAHSKAVRYVPQPFYQYCYNGGSLTQSFKEQKIDNAMRLDEAIRTRLRNYGMPSADTAAKLYFLGLMLAMLKFLILSDRSFADKRRLCDKIFAYPGWKEIYEVLGNSASLTRQKRLLLWLIRHKMTYTTIFFFLAYYKLIKK